MSSAAKDRWQEEDAKWQAIIANYGERPKLPPEETETAAPPRRSLREIFEGFDPLSINQAPTDSGSDPWVDDGRFIPPPPPPVPRPRGWRAVAWAGVLGVPVALVVIALFQIPLPTWFPVAAIIWFIASFAYLISQRKGPQDPSLDWDDGAVL